MFSTGFINSTASKLRALCYFCTDLRKKSFENLAWGNSTEHERLAKILTNKDATGFKSLNTQIVYLSYQFYIYEQDFHGQLNWVLK